MIGIAMLVASCAEPSNVASWSVPLVPCPEGNATFVPPGRLQEMLDAASPGDLLCLEVGEHPGPLAIRKAITIWGPRDAIVRSRGDGTTISVEAAEVRLLGFSVDGSGARFDQTDAAVRVRADRAEVRGLHVYGALFGILVELANRVEIRSNYVEGLGQKAFGLRGDGIRFWEVRGSSIRDNLVSEARDVVVWYSSGNTISGNQVRHCRYGTHFMYSHDNRVENNRYTDNVVGIFVMYSRNVDLRRNLIVRCSGAAGIGLGVKESGNLEVVENAFLANTVSVYLDTSPLDRTHRNHFVRNQIRMSETAVGFHSSPSRNFFEANTLKDNARQVTVGGGGDANGATWIGNHWDDYQGYDLDRDGIGDVPYELQSLSGELISKKPELAFLRGTPAMTMVDIVGHVLPLFAARRVLADPTPRVQGLRLDWLDAR
ncbi:MAG: nitrous oxide reductase family maturation protein NosD [Planctomycetes bacterium]|nr:nitrous oxide reductase family maturation protein NosD [Planctomycetota bacterium]